MPRAERPAARAASCRPVGCESPPTLPATSLGRRTIDRYLRVVTAGNWCYWTLVIIASLGLVALLDGAAELVAAGAVFAIAGCTCLLNFWRCREAHCIVTGVGWFALASFAWAEAVIVGHSIIAGGESMIFLTILIAGYAFEAMWRNRHGTKALHRQR